ncbi:MAG: urease accessory protein UreD [Paracoccaceae bacterium]
MVLKSEKKNKFLKSYNKYQRSKGKLKLSFINSDAETSIYDLHQSGALKVLIPKAKSKHAEAVLINTGGGIVAGDSLSIEVTSYENTNTWITTQASEKVYKSNGELSLLKTKINLGDDSILFWCPKETILFNNSKFKRNLDFNIKSSSKMLVIENIVFGRLASGELNADCYFFDQWRIKRDEKLIFAENFLFEDKKSMYRNTNLGEYRSLMNIMYISHDAKNYLNKMRNIISTGDLFGEASHWNDFISLRALAKNPIEFNKVIEQILILFAGEKSKIPRILSI